EPDFRVRRIGDDFPAGTENADALDTQDRRAVVVVIESRAADLDAVAGSELPFQRGCDPRACHVEWKEPADEENVDQTGRDNAERDDLGARQLSVTRPEQRLPNGVERAAKAA